MADMTPEEMREFAERELNRMSVTIYTLKFSLPGKDQIALLRYAEAVTQAWQKAINRKEWRCFSCDEVFTVYSDAEAHFSLWDDREESPAACVDPLRTDEKLRHEALIMLKAEADEARQEAEEMAKRIAELELELKVCHNIGLRQENQIEKLERDKAEETAIVDKVWKALGISTYEAAKGKAIWELVADLKRDKAGERLRLLEHIRDEAKAWAGWAVKSCANADGSFRIGQINREIEAERRKLEASQ